MPPLQSAWASHHRAGSDFRYFRYHEAQVPDLVIEDHLRELLLDFELGQVDEQRHVADLHTGVRLDDLELCAKGGRSGLGLALGLGGKLLG